MNFRQFVADQRRQDQKIAAELKLQEHQITQELKLKAEKARNEIEQSRKELEQKAEQARKELEQNAEQARKEYELKAEQSRKEYEFRTTELELKKHQSQEELRLKDEKAAKELKLREEELELKREQYKEEMRLKIVELELKKEQSKEGVRLQEGHTKERQRLEELRVTEEIKIKDKEVSASVRLLEQQTQTALAQTNKALKEAEALELKNVRNSKNRPLLADSDRRRVLARVFPKKIGAKCEIVECPTHVCAFSCSIIEAEGYTLGDIDRLLVVCPEHARVNRPRAHAVEHNRRKLETWLYRFGCSSTGLCALCGSCKLAVWHTETHTCHINAAAEGGGDALQNLVIGSVACNQQQGVKPLAEYHAQIRVEPELVKATICVPEDKIEDAMGILMRKHKGICKKCPAARLEAMLVQAPKRKHIQFRLDVRKTTTY
jgi:5-methylcytosine-specific restriction endonuclease McrA